MNKIQLSNAVVISRVRLARNLDGIPFPKQLSPADRCQVQHTIQASIESYDQWKWIDSQAESEVYLLNMKARGILRTRTEEQVWIALPESSGVHAVICDEDHLRIQAYLPGLQLRNAHESAQRLEEAMDLQLDYAFDPDFGYLTAQIANAGTGLRASLLVHLPGLKTTGMIDRVSVAAGQVGLSVQPHFGSGDQAAGHLYRISNQTTLGRTESEIIETLRQVSLQILQREMNARDTLLASKQQELLDQVSRSVGLLTHARKMGLSEAMEHWSNVRLGLGVGWITGVTIEQINRLLPELSAGSLQLKAGRKLSVLELENRRATLLRNRMEAVRILEG